MRVFVNNRESGPLTRRQWKDARKTIPGHPASGRVRNLDDMRAAQLRRGRNIGAAFLVGCWILALIFVIGGSSAGAIGMFAGGALAWPMMYFLIWLSFSVRRADLLERYRGLPELGVLVKADETGLTVGEQFAAWPEISLATARFTADAEGEYVLERLTLAQAFEGVALDVYLIEQGRAVVGYAFLRLCPEPDGGRARA